MTREERITVAHFCKHDGYVPFYDTDTSQVVVMLEAMRKHGAKPSIRANVDDRWACGFVYRDGVADWFHADTIPAAVAAATLACAKDHDHA